MSGPATISHATPAMDDTPVTALSEAEVTWLNRFLQSLMVAHVLPPPSMGMQDGTVVAMWNSLEWHVCAKLYYADNRVDVVATNRSTSATQRETFDGHDSAWRSDVANFISRFVR